MDQTSPPSLSIEAMSYTLRMIMRDGTIRETELTAAQALDLGAGQPISYFPRDERLLIDDDGTITVRESAIPQQLDEAA